MPQTSAKPDAAPQTGARSGPPGNLTATSQFLVFDPGLFILDLAAPQSAATDMGLRLPAIRLDPTPLTQDRPGRAVVTGSIEQGWIWRTDEPVFVLVTGGRAGMMLTVCRADTAMSAPEIRFRQIQTSLGGAPDAPAGAIGTAPVTDAASVPLTLLAHIRNSGDVTGPGGRWLGTAGRNAPIEGFAVSPGPAVAPGDLEYQAILGNSWNTPWFTAGEFCGSRGMLLPLLGFRVRLKGTAAEAFEVRYMGSFAGGSSPVTGQDGEACTQGDSALEAIQIVIVKREAVAAPVLAAEPAAVAKPRASVQKPAPKAPAKPGKAQSAVKPKSKKK